MCVCCYLHTHFCDTSSCSLSAAANRLCDVMPFSSGQKPFQPRIAVYRPFRPQTVRLAGIAQFAVLVDLVMYLVTVWGCTNSLRGGGARLLIILCIRQSWEYFMIFSKLNSPRLLYTVQWWAVLSFLSRAAHLYSTFSGLRVVGCACPHDVQPGLTQNRNWIRKKINLLS